MANFSLATLTASLIGLPVGHSRVFAFDDIRFWDLEKYAKQIASKHRFSIRITADYGGLRIEKTKGEKGLKIRYELLSMKDNQRLLLELAPSMLPTIKRHVRAIEVEYPDRTFAVGVVDGGIEVLCGFFEPDAAE